MSSLQEVAVALERNLTEGFELLGRNSGLSVDNWLATCDEAVRLLRKTLRETECTVSVKQSVMATLGRLRGLQVRAQRSGALIARGGGLQQEQQPSVSVGVERICWQDSETAFKNRLFTGVVTNLDHIDPRKCVLENQQIQSVLTDFTMEFFVSAPCKKLWFHVPRSN